MPFPQSGFNIVGSISTLGPKSQLFEFDLKQTFFRIIQIDPRRAIDEWEINGKSF